MKINFIETNEDRLVGRLQDRCSLSSTETKKVAVKVSKDKQKLKLNEISRGLSTKGNGIGKKFATRGRDLEKWPPWILDRLLSFDRRKCYRGRKCFFPSTASFAKKARG